MGLAAALDLARRGASVTVLERHDIGHDLGSHSGFTRVIRHAYNEGAHYVPLVQEADAAWVGNIFSSAPVITPMPNSPAARDFSFPSASKR